MVLRMLQPRKIITTSATQHLAGARRSCVLSSPLIIVVTLEKCVELARSLEIWTQGPEKVSSCLRSHRIQVWPTPQTLTLALCSISFPMIGLPHVSIGNGLLTLEQYPCGFPVLSPKRYTQRTSCLIQQLTDWNCSMGLKADFNRKTTGYHILNAYHVPGYDPNFERMLNHLGIPKTYTIVTITRSHYYYHPWLRKQRPRTLSNTALNYSVVLPLNRKSFSSAKYWLTSYVPCLQKIQFPHSVADLFKRAQDLGPRLSMLQHLAYGA